MLLCLEELSIIDGVDFIKCEKYGERFINIIKSISDLGEETKTDNTSTTGQTYHMFQNKKMTIKDISRLRNIRPQTIENHITELYRRGYELDLHRLEFYDDIYEQIHDKIIELDNPVKLKIIKNSLPKGISYLHIKLAQVRMEK